MKALFQELSDRLSVRRAFSRNAPRYLRRPFEYLARRNIKLQPAETKVFSRIEALREEMARSLCDEVDIYYSPKPRKDENLERPRHGDVKKFDVARIANHTSVSPYWGRFLHILAVEKRAKTILELGTCAGISGCYLSSTEFCERFITIEASSELCSIARRNLGAVTDRAEVHNGLFDEVLDKLLPTLAPSSLDLVWIDGHHEQIATIHYFQRLRKYLAKGALVLFDDISWSADMRECWDKLATTPGFSHTFDLKTLKGMCVWQGGEIQPELVFVAKPFGKVAIGTPRGWKEG